MKRLAVLTLTAGLLGAGPTLFAAPPVPVAATAPTVPSVPAPVLRGEVLTPADPTGPAPVTVHPRTPGERLLHPPRLLPNSTATEPYDPYATNRAVVSQQPGVPASPAPTGQAPANPVTGSPPSTSPATATPATTTPATTPPIVVGGTCPANGCATTGHGGNCWEKFKDWFCYRQTPVRLGLTPTPYYVPLACQFPCGSGPGCASAAAVGKQESCGPRVGGRAGGHAALPCRGTAGGCSPVAPDPVLPGYRFAENLSVGGAPTPVPVVVNPSFKPTPPVPVIPYKPSEVVSPRP